MMMFENIKIEFYFHCILWCDDDPMLFPGWSNSSVRRTNICTTTANLFYLTTTMIQITAVWQQRAAAQVASKTSREIRSDPKSFQGTKWNRVTCTSHFRKFRTKTMHIISMLFNHQTRLFLSLASWFALGLCPYDPSYPTNNHYLANF